MGSGGRGNIYLTIMLKFTYEITANNKVFISLILFNTIKKLAFIDFVNDSW